ncbi:MAG: WD40 repeat domain-containing protein, partial [Clostridia bacterium]
GVLAEGGCATFIIINLDSEKIIFSQDAPGATGSWGVAVASDGRVYFGTYVNAGLYRFDPETEQLETVFLNLPNAKFIFSLDVDSKNNVYGGTWPNCAVFKYNGNEEKMELYDENVVEGEDYVRMVLYDEKRDVLYASISAHCHVIEYKPGTGPLRDILPEAYRNEAFARLIDIHDGKISIYMTKAKKILVIDLDNGELLHEIDGPDDSSEHLPVGVDPASLVSGKRNNGIVLDMTTLNVYNFKSESNETIMGLWAYSDGESILLTGFEGVIYIYNVKSGIRKKLEIEIPRKSIEIRQLHTSADGRIYASGYLRGGSYIFDPETDTGSQYDGVGQSEGITSCGSRIYFGKYPGAYVYEFDSEKEWDYPKNPREIFELKTGYNQDRPFAMQATEGKLFVGTIPEYGDLQGALAVYDMKNGALEVRKDFSDSRSIVSLAIMDGILFGGTTVCGGLGSRSKHESGTVFAIDIETGEYLYEVIPVEGCRNAGGLCIAYDGKLLGCADSAFFILDRKTGRKEFEKKLTEFNRDKDYKWEVSFIKRGRNRFYYIVTSNTLFSYDHETREFKEITGRKVNLLEFDSRGRLYCQYEDNVREIIRSKMPVD